MANEMRLVSAKDVEFYAAQHFSFEIYKAVNCAVRYVPRVDAKPVVHGRWEHLGGDEWCCTVCGEVITTDGSWVKPDKKYCYECGSKMDGGDGDE